MVGSIKEGVLTNDPSAILATRRLLPTGYWKGSGLALCSISWLLFYQEDYQQLR
jgi:hypothetical protein